MQVKLSDLLRMDSDRCEKIIPEIVMY